MEKIHKRQGEWIRTAGAVHKDRKENTTVKVVKINGEGAFRRRIMDMGITKNSEIYVRKVAPLGDPVEITVRGYELSLRRDDAESVEVVTV